MNIYNEYLGETNYGSCLNEENHFWGNAFSGFESGIFRDSSKMFLKGFKEFSANILIFFKEKLRKTLENPSQPYWNTLEPSRNPFKKSLF